ncbi:hypothetical protein V1509DRAFT_610177 [Lipomyces kononenkoae]
MTEIFIDSTFGTNKHGYELYCVITEYDLVSILLSYLLLDTRGVQEVGKRGSRLTTWLMALRGAGLNPCVIHTDKDFADRSDGSEVLTVGSLKDFAHDLLTKSKVLLDALSLGQKLPLHFAKDLIEHYANFNPGYSFLTEMKMVLMVASL